MSFDRAKPFAEAITGAHMGRTLSWARSLEVLPWREHLLFTGGRRFGEAEPASAKRSEQTLP
jgi:hypothetical protein